MQIKVCEVGVSCTTLDIGQQDNNGRCSGVVLSHPRYLVLLHVLVYTPGIKPDELRAYFFGNLENLGLEFIIFTLPLPPCI